MLAGAGFMRLNTMPEPAPNPHRARTLVLVSVLHGFTHLYGVALLPLYLNMQVQMGLASVEQATALVTLMGIGYFLPSYFMGVLADRASRKTLLSLGLAINALGFVALAFAPTYAWAVAGVLLAGAGGSFYHPSATALIAELFPEARGKALGLAGIGASVGFFAGPIYSGWRAAASGSWRTPVLELGLMGLVAAAAFAWLAVETRHAHPSPSVARVKEPLFGSAALWVFFLGTALMLSMRDFAGSAMATSASLFFQKARMMDSGATGVALSGIFLASAISNPLFGRLSDRGRIRWLAFLLISAAVLMFLFPRVPSALSIPVLITYGFFFMASYPVTEAALMEAVPDAVRGRVFGLFITIGGLVGNTSHWLVGDWVSHLGGRASTPAGFYWIFNLLALLVIGSLLALPFIRGLSKREHALHTGFSAPTPREAPQT